MHGILDLQVGEVQEMVEAGKPQCRTVTHGRSLEVRTAT